MTTNNELPPVPQTGIDPLQLPADQEQRLLGRRRKADHVDPFASDPDEDIRRLGRLALRRDVPHAHDYLALGDLCAAKSLLIEQGRLLIFYVGKTIYAYRRAEELAGDESADGELARAAFEHYVRWLVRLTRVAPSRRNIAVTLWAVADVADAEPPIEDLFDEAQLLALWYVSPPHVDAQTPAPERTPSPPEDVTDLYPEEVLTHMDEGTEGAGALLSMEKSIDLGETRSDQSDIFQYEIEATRHSPSAVPRPISSSSSASRPFRRAEGSDFDYGDRIDGRYQVAQVLRGGMGIVYLCYDHEERQSVALKTFQSRYLTNESVVARFLNEARTWINLEKHPHIVQARLVQKFEGRPHIIL